MLPFVPLLPQLPNKQYAHLLEEFRADPLAYHGGLRARVLSGAPRTLIAFAGVCLGSMVCPSRWSEGAPQLLGCCLAPVVFPARWRR